MTKLKIAASFFACILLLESSAATATSIREVTSSGGIKAWLVEDHKLPLVSLHFAFRGGVEQDPADKQGLATLTTALLTQGAGRYDAAAFQQQLADSSIALSFGAGRDNLSGHLKTLSTSKNKAFQLLALALTEPRFDDKDIERARARQRAMLRQQFGDPDWQARYALFAQIFGNHPYGQRRFGSEATLSSITADDIRGFAQHHLAQDNLVIAVAGDMTPDELKTALDKTFGQLPQHAHVTQIEDVAWPSDTPTILVRREGVQTNLMFAMPGPKRDDPEWYAAEIANYILGGGGFSSRLMQDVRDKKGLTYGISTSLLPAEHAGMIAGEADISNPRTGEALKTALTTMHEFYDNGVNAREITAAKDFLTGSLALALTSTDRIASMLVMIQIDHLGMDYLDRYGDLIRRVSTDDITHAIEHWFNPDRLTLVAVGKPEGLSPNQIRDQVKE